MFLKFLWNNLLWDVVDAPKLIIYLLCTPVFEWYVVWCGYKNKYEKDICLKEIGLHAQNMITILSLSQHDWGDLYDHLLSTKIFTLIIYKIIIGAPKIMRKVSTASIWIC